MDDAIFSKIVLNSEERKKEAASFEHKRYLYEELQKVPPEYFIGVSGLRGIGKTILLLQMANEVSNSLYFSADAVYLKNEELYGIIKKASSSGYKHIFVDEVQNKENWQQDLKTLYDEKEARVVFTGSSAIEINKGADLSRRALMFHLKPISFREFLLFKKGEIVEKITPAQLFDEKQRKAIVMKTAKYDNYLQEYFQTGGVLYPSTGIEPFYKAIENTLDKIIHSDLEYLREIDVKIENDVHKILETIALSPVGETNYSKIAGNLSVSKPTLIKIIGDLEKIGVIKRILPCGKARLRKEPKLYLAFPFRSFFTHVLLRKQDVGALREEFFANHVEHICYFKGNRGEKTPDFSFAGKKVEIGGAGKNFGQNPDFVVSDAITFEPNKIPLYLIGLLY